MKAVILSGGFGTRLRPLTLSQPKVALPILNKPFYLYPLEWLTRHGVTDAVFATGYRSRDLAAILKKGKPREINVSLKTEQEPLGTGGALRHAAGKHPGRLLALNGDILTNFNLSKMLRFHHHRGALITVALIKVPDVSRYGSVSLGSGGSLEKFVEKRADQKRQGFVNAGIYILEPQIINLIPSKTPCSLERDVFPRLAQERRGIYGYPIQGYWKDVGTLSSYLDTHRDFLTQGHLRPTAHHPSKSTVLIGKGTRLHSSARLEGIVSIGLHCRIGAGTRIKNSVILNHVTVGENVEIEGCILSYRCRIGSHSKLREGTVLGEGSRIPDYSQC